MSVQLCHLLTLRGPSLRIRVLMTKLMQIKGVQTTFRGCLREDIFSAHKGYSHLYLVPSRCYFQVWMGSERMFTCSTRCCEGVHIQTLNVELTFVCCFHFGSVSELQWYVVYLLALCLLRGCPWNKNNSHKNTCFLLEYKSHSNFELVPFNNFLNI